MEKINNPTLEYWFTQWVKEVKKAGYIDKIVFGKEVLKTELFDSIYKYKEEEVVVYKGTKRETTKIKLHKSRIFGNISYTADCIIRWNKKAEGIFYRLQEDWDYFGPNPYFRAFKNPKMVDPPHLSMVDVKAPAGYGSFNSSDVSFAIKKRILYEQSGVYVNKCMLMPNKIIKTKLNLNYLFEATFTPNRFLFTDKLKGKRTIPNVKGINKWQVRSIQQFLK